LRRHLKGPEWLLTAKAAAIADMFVEREIERWLSARVVTVALPVEEPKAEAPAAAQLNG
jgi:hypothetical protein